MHSLACRECLQSAQSSQCCHQFTPPAALRKLLQKQPGGSNALSGERSHLTTKELFSAAFPNINTLQSGFTTVRALRDPATAVPRQSEVLLFPTTLRNTSSTLRVVVINVEHQGNHLVLGHGNLRRNSKPPNIPSKAMGVCSIKEQPEASPRLYLLQLSEVQDRLWKNWLNLRPSSRLNRGRFMIFISEILWNQLWPLNNPPNVPTILSLQLTFATKLCFTCLKSYTASLFGNSIVSDILQWCQK